MNNLNKQVIMMEQNTNTQNSMNEQNAMNTEDNSVKRLLPTAEVIERNDYLSKKINELLDKDEVDYYEVNSYAGEQYELHEKYNFFDQEFVENGLKGVKDIKGNIRIPALYKDFYELYDYCVSYAPELKNFPICAYNQNEKCALVAPDGKGTPLTPFIYDAIRKNMFGSFFTLLKDGKKGLMDRKGNILIPCKMDVIYDAFNGIYTFESDGKSGLYTDWGLYIEPIYDEMTENDEYVYARLGNTWGYIDCEGHFINEKDQETLDESDLLNMIP